MLPCGDDECGWLVNRCFQPSQPLGLMTSGLTNVDGSDDNSDNCSEDTDDDSSAAFSSYASPRAHLHVMGMLRFMFLT